MSYTVVENENKPYTNAFGSTKMGRVSIAVEIINKEPHIAQAVMSHIIPIQSLYIPDRESVLYLAISTHFDSLSSDEIVPVYLSQFHSDGNVTFVRTEYKKNVKESTREQIIELMVINNVNMVDFKEWVRRTQPATEEDFKQFNDTFLEILKIYIKRR